MRARLAIMMALLYAVQGTWYPLLAVHLKDLGLSGEARGWIFATFAIGCFAAPIGAGQLADRLIPADRLMAIIYAIAAALLGLMASEWVAGAWPIFALFLVYWLVVAPASGLSNAIALRNLARPREQFGGVRLWGTIGWMVAGWVVAQVMAMTGSDDGPRGASEAFAVGAVAAMLFAFYCLLLPRTPPLAVGGRGLGWSEAADDARLLVRRPIVALYLVTAFGVTLTIPYMFQVQPTYLEHIGLPRRWVAPAMTLGQVPEIAALWALPWMFRRLGDRGTLALGILAWVVRYGVLMLDPPLWLAVAGIPLHGIGIGCFTVAGQMFLDSQAPPHRRAGAQGLHTVITAGFGALLGNLLAGVVVGRSGDSAVVFIVPFAVNAVLLVAWAGLSRRAFQMGRAAPGASTAPSPAGIAVPAVGPAPGSGGRTN
ncbi:MFS transporter [Tautonia sociabilis]|uniref:Nucleoside H+ symporter n=1 Tax=Tautonia sociabilis TaxID=2080755 RepID=A0A432MKI5_9BACT|nr:MFS transporter [Tautonia sociabilis]RUL87646.1 nucleoside H+ symporter [Tautonia sociabilis]